MPRRGDNNHPSRKGYMDHSSCDHGDTRDERRACRARLKRELSPKEYEKRIGKVATPAQRRKRAQRARRVMEHELEHLWTKPVSEWDYEELVAGRPRDERGRLPATPPKIVPHQVAEERERRLKRLLNYKLQSLSVPAVDVLMEIMQDEDTTASTRAQIATYLVNRVIGTPTQHVESDVKMNLADMLAQWVAHPGEDPSDPQLPEYVDAEVVDEDDDDDIPAETHGATHPKWTRNQRDDDPPKGY